MALIGPDMAFKIDSIDSVIKVALIAYAHKSGERFGPPEYPDLISKIKGVEVVGRAEIRVNRPLIGSGDIPKRSMRVGARDLEIGETYRLEGARTPLMPSPGADRLDGIVGTMYLPAGTVVAVIGMMSRSGDPWYHVSRPARAGREGWINSIALLADGAYRLSDDASAQASAAQMPDYRQEAT